MARPLRIEFENAFYHITSRGNERKLLFINEVDYKKFLNFLEQAALRYKPVVYSYGLMGNHYHLLLETSQPNLSRLMRDLNGAYTTYFNRRHKRNGHLFQGRFKAILVDKENYLLELSRYIHLNPVRAKIAKLPEEYKYSSIDYYFSGKKAPFWLNTEVILSQFGSNKTLAREEFRKFVYQGITNSVDPFKGVHAKTFLGSADFVDKIKREYLKNQDISPEIACSKTLRSSKTLSQIAEIVAKHYNIDLESLRRKRGKVNYAKKLFVYFSRKYTDSRLEQISSFLNNNVSEAAISKMFKRTEEEIEKKEELREGARRLGELISV